MGRRRRVDPRQLAFDWEAPAIPRPRTRAGCQGAPRPCPWVGCRHHLADLRWSEERILEYIEESEFTCSLDVGDSGEHGHEFVARLLRATVTGTKQIEHSAFVKIRKKGKGDLI